MPGTGRPGPGGGRGAGEPPPPRTTLAAQAISSSGWFILLSGVGLTGRAPPPFPFPFNPIGICVRHVRTQDNHLPGRFVTSPDVIGELFSLFFFFSLNPPDFLFLGSRSSRAEAAAAGGACSEPFLSSPAASFSSALFSGCVWTRGTSAGCRAAWADFGASLHPPDLQDPRVHISGHKPTQQTRELGERLGMLWPRVLGRAPRAHHTQGNHGSSDNDPKKPKGPRGGVGPAPQRTAPGVLLRFHALLPLG